MEEEIINRFGNRLRVRVCGLLAEENKLLMVKHKYLGEQGILWVPPGGGMKFGTSAEENLIREFNEETGLIVDIAEFRFVHEFLSPPLHAIELFFEVKRVSGELKKGIDPELKRGDQIIEEVKFQNFDQILAAGTGKIHNIFTYCKSMADLFGMNGYYIFDGLTKIG